MRTVFMALIIGALVLAGCGASTPTATPAPPTVTPPATQQEFNPVASLVGTIDVPVPGTLVMQSQVGTTNPPTRSPVTFTDLSFAQTGGIAHLSLSIELRNDGTLIRDGKTSTVNQDDVAKITALLDNMDFFNMQGIFTSPGGAADLYTYSVTVTTPDRSLTITTQDGLTPPQLNQLYDAIRNLNQT